MTEFDVIVLGGGAAGEHCAGALSAGGARVAVVEQDLVGGECSYWACIPSKSLLRPGEAVHAARQANASASVDVEATLAWRDFMVSAWSDLSATRWLSDSGITLVRGHGRLVAPGTVEVAGSTMTARHVVIATGSQPTVPDIAGLGTVPGVWTNREATAMRTVPRRLIVLGAGPVGVELAQAIRRLGSEVVLVSDRQRVLPREPEQLGDALAAALRDDGIELVFRARATSVAAEGGDLRLTLSDGRVLSGEKLLLATGRRPRVDDIGVNTVGVRTTPSGIVVDERLRAGDRIWAVGDVTGIWPLTHVGKYQAEVAAADILGGRRTANYDAVPRVVFTDPQAAAVGVADDCFSGTARLADVARLATYTRSYATSTGYLTLHSDGHHLTGAHAVGPEAGEWIGQATLAIRAEIPLDVLIDTIQPFPTFSEIYVTALAALAEKTGHRTPPTALTATGR